MKKCSCNGVIFKPDGLNELDPCIYDEIQTFKNVTVHICQCKRCGNIDISWEKQEDTEEIFE